MSLFGNAALAGGAVGSAVAGGAVDSAAAGALYGATSWAVVCAVLAGLLVLGAVAGPWALRQIGLRDRPTAISKPAGATKM